MKVLLTFLPGSRLTLKTKADFHHRKILAVRYCYKLLLKSSNLWFYYLLLLVFYQVISKLICLDKCTLYGFKVFLTLSVLIQKENLETKPNEKKLGSPTGKTSRFFIPTFLKLVFTIVVIKVFFVIILFKL